MAAEEKDSPRGTDLVSGPVIVRGLRFDDRLRIGGAEYLESVTGKSVLDLAKDLESAKVSTIRALFTALYIQANPDEDPVQAVRKVQALELADMMVLTARIRAFSFEPKADEAAVVPLTEGTAAASTGPQST